MTCQVTGERHGLSCNLLEGRGHPLHKYLALHSFSAQLIFTGDVLQHLVEITGVREVLVSHFDFSHVQALEIRFEKVRDVFHKRSSQKKVKINTTHTFFKVDS